MSVCSRELVLVDHATSVSVVLDAGPWIGIVRIFCTNVSVAKDKINIFTYETSLPRICLEQVDHPAQNSSILWLSKSMHKQGSGTIS